MNREEISSLRGIDRPWEFLQILSVLINVLHSSTIAYSDHSSFEITHHTSAPQRKS